MKKLTVMVAIGLAAVLIPGSVTVHGFDSYGCHRIHDSITESAARAAGFSKEKINQLQEAVRAPDWNESSWRPTVQAAKQLRKRYDKRLVRQGVK